MSKQNKRRGARSDIAENNQKPRNEPVKPFSRREILRGVTIGGVLLSVDKWSRPVIESVSIPAHAQSSIGLAGGDSEQVILPESNGGP